MREIISFIASLAASAILTSLAVLLSPQSVLWKFILWGCASVLLLCAFALLFDILRRRRRRESLRSRANINTDACIRIVTGTGSPFDFFKSHLYSKNHLIRLGLCNSSPARLTNCELILESITGRLAHRCPVKIRSGVNLNPGATEYIDLFDFDETERGPPLSQPAAIRAHFPINPLSNGESWLDDQPYEMALKATAGESLPHNEDYRLWVTDDGHLHFEPQNGESYHEERMSLWKAVDHVRKAINDTDSKECYPLTRAAIRQAALDGKIRIYGHKSDRPMGEGRNYNLVSTLIPQAYWETADIGPLAVEAQFADQFDCLTFPHRMSGGKFGTEIHLYAKCTVIWREVQKQWH